MVSVLILDGFTDVSPFKGAELSSVADIYVSYFYSLLGLNGIECCLERPSGLEHSYSVVGKLKENLIYVPSFSYSALSEPISFIYTDSTLTSSLSFRIASRIRNLRENEDMGAIFVNELHAFDPLRAFSPIVADNIAICEQNSIGEYKAEIVSAAETAVKAVCDCCRIEFCGFRK